MSDKDLLDLCRLNEMEEHGTSTEEDQKELKEAIDHSKKRVMSRIRFNQPKVTRKVIKIHQDRQIK